MTGKITADRGDRLELLIEQGTDVTWGGISGTAICIGEGVAGVITNEVPHTNTLGAASSRVVARWPISRNVPTQFQRGDPPDFRWFPFIF
jgi:hypothetical protein